MAVAATPAPKSRSSARGQWSLSHLGPFLTTWWSQQSIINFSESPSNKTHDFRAFMASALTDNDWHVDILWEFAPMLLRKGANIWQPRVPKRAWNSHPKMLHREIYAHVPPRWATCHVECPHLSFSPFLARKQREAWIVIWSTWTLDDLEFLGSLFQVWLKSQQRIFYITASIHGLQSIDEAGSLNAAYLDVVGLSTPSWILLLLFASAICLLQVWSLMSFLFLFWICI